MNPKVGPSKPKNTGNAGKGRKPGVPNKTTRVAKEAIAIAAEGLGGATRLEAWVREDPQNERAFWTSIYPRLLPVQVTGEDGAPLIPQNLSIVVRKADDADCRP